MTDIESVVGVGPTIAKKLREIGITTAEILAVQEPEALEKSGRLGEGTSTKLVRNAREAVGGFSFMNGLDFETIEQSVPKLKIGVDSLDEGLLGGIEAGSIVEVYGPSRAGKSVFCHQLAVRAQLGLESGGIGSRVLWFDSERSFKSIVIRGIAHRFDMDPEVALGNISLADIITIDQFHFLLDRTPRLCAKSDIRLIVIDSLTGLFPYEYVQLSMRHHYERRLVDVIDCLRRICRSTGAIAIYTNRVFNNLGSITGSINQPMGGHVLSHASNYRFGLRRFRNEKRRFSLRINVSLPEFDLDLHIGWGGFFRDRSSRKKAEWSIRECLGLVGSGETGMEGAVA